MLDDIEKLLGSEVLALARTPPVYIEAESISVFDDKFLALNPDIDRKHKTVYELYTAWLNEDRYAVTSATGYAPGVFDANRTTMVYNGEQTLTESARDRLILVKNDRLSKPSNSLPLGTALFAPYSFILTPNPAQNGFNKLPLLTPASFNLKSFVSQLNSLKITLEKDGVYSVLALYESGSSSRISIDPAALYRVKSWTSYNSKGNKTSSIEVNEIGVADLAGTAYYYPKRYTLNRYIDGFSIGKRVVEVKALRLMNKDERIEEKGDVSSADVIVDQDSGVQITVPR